MSKCYWLLNHPVLMDQEKELRKCFNIDEILKAPESVLKFWSNIPVSKLLPASCFNETINWLSNADSKDVVVIQGEPTATYRIVSFLKKKSVTVLAGITQRKSIESNEEGKVVKVSIYEHICFREYVEWS